MRELTYSERTSFLFRHPSLFIKTPFLPPEGILVKDDTYGCVLVFEKTNGQIMAIDATDVYPNCTWNSGPGKTSAFISELKNQISNRSNDMLDYLKYIVRVSIIIMIVYFVSSGKLQKLINELK